MGRMDDLRRFFRANPQALVLLVICLVLGLGTFLIVIFGIATSKSTTATGEPSGSLRAPAAVTASLQAPAAFTASLRAPAALTVSLSAPRLPGPARD